MTNTKDVILELKAVRDEKGLSYNDIMKKLEEEGQYPISKSTIARVFSDGSEDLNFDYERTIRPIANALLDIETIEDTDDTDTKGMKSILKYKAARISELEAQVSELKAAVANEKVKYHERLDKERDQHQRSIEFLKNQIELKDKRMDQLMDAVFQKDKQHDELLQLIITCPGRKEHNDD